MADLALALCCISVNLVRCTCCDTCLCRMLQVRELNERCQKLGLDATYHTVQRHDDEDGQSQNPDLGMDGSLPAAAGGGAAGGGIGAGRTDAGGAEGAAVAGGSGGTGGQQQQQDGAGSAAQAGSGSPGSGQHSPRAGADMQETDRFEEVRGIGCENWRRHLPCCIGDAVCSRFLRHDGKACNQHLLISSGTRTAIAVQSLMCMLRPCRSCSSGGNSVLFHNRLDSVVVCADASQATGRGARRGGGPAGGGP